MVAANVGIELTNVEVIAEGDWDPMRDQRWARGRDR